MSNPYRPVHRLDSVTFNLHLGRLDEEHEHQLAVHGRATTKRADLWTYVESFDPVASRANGYSAADALHHIALVACQDRPNTIDRLQFALSGGLLYQEQELPFL